MGCFMRMLSRCTHSPLTSCTSVLSPLWLAQFIADTGHNASRVLRDGVVSTHMGGLLRPTAVVADPDGDGFFVASG
jgi:hypothetical protein